MNGTLLNFFLFIYFIYTVINYFVFLFLDGCDVCVRWHYSAAETSEGSVYEVCASQPVQGSVRRQSPCKSTFNIQQYVYADGLCAFVHFCCLNSVKLGKSKSINTSVRIWCL